MSGLYIPNPMKNMRSDMKRFLIVLLLLTALTTAFCMKPKKTIFDIAANGSISELQKILKMKLMGMFYWELGYM